MRARPTTGWPRIVLIASIAVGVCLSNPAAAQQRSATEQQPAAGEQAARSLALRAGYCAAFFEPNGDAAQKLQLSGRVPQSEATRFLLWFYFSASMSIPDTWRQPYALAGRHGGEEARSADLNRIVEVYGFCKPVTPPSATGEPRPMADTAAAAAEPLATGENTQMVRKLKRCWQVRNAGGDPAQMTVLVIVDMTSDGRVDDAKLAGETQAALAQNAPLRAFAAAALRAVLDPRCQPLPSKGEARKPFVLKLDPRELR